MYADDTAILARHKNPNYIQIALNRHLKALEDWFIKWKIEINVSKTEAIMFANARSYFPIGWKTAVVVPILKPGKDPTQSEDYRPISLLNTLGKLTENFILDKLNAHLLENKILCPEQFGFRKSLTTTHQLLRAVEYITSGFEKAECTGAVFLDVHKAFDRVWIHELIHKLIRYKTPPHLLQLLKSYLEERKFAVKIGNSISEAKIMRAGIPQGEKSCRTSTLFILTTFHKRIKHY
ncbi:putative RNA-directed DNA polymerase from transposon BS [Araneus ventricosus]|uniref:Putative RNA-directed DNA polymerase from transposon BS n=1 Tax=Araneus ventricosus TaxID=182803 RepID=A0A4Y2U0G8_ARAVE|nr:putative RNA-directed DNA polymerase from transposon BS [Araneus ventricosus]